MDKNKFFNEILEGLKFGDSFEEAVGRAIQFQKDYIKEVRHEMLSNPDFLEDIKENEYDIRLSGEEHFNLDDYDDEMEMD